MDEDDEDIEALFFAEAKELLESLQEQLNLLADGAGDDETIHAAFRAVHSVKGGAAAFGFDRLIAFAHQFETVMDRLREGQLDPDGDLFNLLLRCGDMMQLLVEEAQSGAAPEDDSYRQLLADLCRLADAPPPEAAPGAMAQDAPDTAPVAECAVDPPADRDILVRITPDADFIAAGHDMLKLVRAACDLGLKEVHFTGSVPGLDRFDPMVVPGGFELLFAAPDGAPPLEDFFRIYDHIALVEFPEDPPSAEVAGDDRAIACAPDADPPAANREEVSSKGEDGLATTAGPSTSAPARPAADAGAAQKSLRVDLTRIDRLVNLVGEMLISQAALAQQVATTTEGEGLASEIDGLSRLLRELQESVMAIRAQPVKSVFRRMPRVVRDLADKLGKDARLELSGEQTEVDATVIEELTEPLTHMIRNAMDHGLETPAERAAAGKPATGRIRLSAEHHGERVAIVVEDDGKGVDRDRVYRKAVDRGLIVPDEALSPEEIDSLIFHPGFSTAEKVSSVSGRGVGMDVVKKKIVSLGGRCAFESRPGQGTKFTITLPLTLAVMDGMTVRLGEQHYILPLSSVVEALRLPGDRGRSLPDGARVLQRRGEYLRLIDLRTMLGLPAAASDADMAIVVDTEVSGPVAVVVDELIGQRQVVLKSLETNFKQVDGVSGATIMGNGHVALILDIPALVGPRGQIRPLNEVYH